jgi:hypothetical protein
MADKISIELTEEQWNNILYEIKLGLDCYYIDDSDKERERIPCLEQIKSIIEGVINVPT